MTTYNNNSDTTKKYEDILAKLTEYSKLSAQINLNLYQEYDVKRGLRDANGKGVLAGLTEISDVLSTEVKNGQTYPALGRLYYQGYNIKDLIKGTEGKRFAFEETTFLLLFGQLPSETQFALFQNILADMRTLPETFVRDIIMTAPTENMMNVLQRCILTLYTYDQNPDDTSIANVLRQCLSLIALFPLISVYGYHVYRHYHLGKSLLIRNPKPELSIAENILRMLHIDGTYTELEARVLDAALVLHAEHGGGNNSTFTTNVVTSTGTDTYSAIAASLGSVKGPKHGGANIKVQHMFQDIKEHVTDWEDMNALTDYLNAILDKKAFDNAGLIYGMGHAVYSLSDPRADVLKGYARALSAEKGLEREFQLYENVERIAKDLITSRRNVFKPVCANVDFYSGFVYTMLGLPEELFTPMFAISRISGWSAHRIEELVSGGKIIRPAYKYVGHHTKYRPMEERDWELNFKEGGKNRPKTKEEEEEENL